MEGSLIYLASPFTTIDPVEKEWRFLKACDASGFLMQSLDVVYSPIAFGWPIAKLRDMPTDWEYWSYTCQVMISRCQRFIILTLPGWKESTGVNAETKLAIAYGMQIEYMNPDTYEISLIPSE